MTTTPYYTAKAMQEKTLSQALMGIYNSFLELKNLVNDPNFEEYLMVLELGVPIPELVKEWPFEREIIKIFGERLISHYGALKRITMLVRNIGYKRDQFAYVYHFLFKFYDHLFNNEVDDKYCEYLALYHLFHTMQRKFKWKLARVKEWYKQKKSEAFLYLSGKYEPRLRPKAKVQDIILETVTYRHIFLKQHKEGWMPETLKIGKGEQAPRIGSVGDSGAGKTSLHLRIINMLLEEGYTGLSISEDKKHALRCAALPMGVGRRDNQDLRETYRILTEFQGEKPKGLNISFFVQDPVYEFIDRSFDNFDFKLLQKKSWLFHVEGDLKEIVKIFQEEQSRKKYGNLFLFADELQNIHPRQFMENDKKRYNISVAVKEINSSLRGSGIVGLFNTLEPKTIPPNLQFTYLFASYISRPNDRKLVRDMFQRGEERKQIETILSTKKNLEEHNWYLLPDTMLLKILLPPCSPNIIGHSDKGSKLENIIAGYGGAAKIRKDLERRYEWFSREGY